MKLSVIIPAYNEEATVALILRKVHVVEIEKEILFVDDGSADATYDLAEKLLAEIPELRLFRHERNRGKSAAIRTGLREATGEIVIIQDADLEYDPKDYFKVIAPIEAGEADVVYGSRILGGGGRSYLRYYLGGRFVSLLTTLLYWVPVSDEPTCYKAFRRELIQAIELKEEGFGFCAEATAKVLGRGFRFKEVPISYNPRRIEEGKKITWRDGVAAAWILLKYRFHRSHDKPEH